MLIGLVHNGLGQWEYHLKKQLIVAIGLLIVQLSVSTVCLLVVQNSSKNKSNTTRILTIYWSLLQMVRKMLEKPWSPHNSNERYKQLAGSSWVIQSVYIYHWSIYTFSSHL